MLETNFVWLAAESSAGWQPRTGTITDYAKAWEVAYYSGDLILSGSVLVWSAPHESPVEHPVTFKWGPGDGNLQQVTISVNGESAIRTVS